MVLVISLILESSLRWKLSITLYFALTRFYTIFWSNNDKKGTYGGGQ